VIDAFTFVEEVLILVKALLNDALSNRTESTVLETFRNEVFRTATLPETLATLVLRFEHILETFVQQEFRYPLVVVSVFNVGITVVLFVFSRLISLK
jgi:hypothetical protein